jgi:pimeloyl-ACP methyl ester carboxylesterase
MATITLSAGAIEYGDTGGGGPVVVLTHGLLMDASVWQTVVADLSRDFRCVTPTLPVGAHRIPLLPEADLSLPGLAGLLGEFLDRLGLEDVTLVVNDLGCPLLLAADGHPRVGALVLTPCEAFDNLPPGLPGKVVDLTARIPGALWVAAQSLRLPGLARLPLTFGWMSKRPIPRSLLDQWLQPARRSAAVRRDLRRYNAAADAATLHDGTERLHAFHRPALVVWAREDRVMPPAHGARLAALLPQATLAEVDDSYTLMPLDRPGELARLLREFVHGLPPRPRR